MKRLEISFVELIRNIKQNRPVTNRTLTALGLSDLQKKSFSNGAHYTETDILLSDGNIIEKIELRESDKGSLLVFYLGQHSVTRKDLEEEFGSFSLRDIPKGRSIKERIVYSNDTIENFTVMFGLDQTTRELLVVSIKSVFNK
jgi:hypothetical protein